MPHAKPRLYRDPVHDTIVLEPDSDEGRLLIALLDAREVQRLRRIRQLALSFLVYHGAEHSRFAHSIGVAWLARRMLDRVQRSADIPAEERLVTLAAALLHDVGHGPFSHALEALCGERHEERSVALVMDPDTDVHRALADVDARLPERVAARIAGTDESAPPYLREIVSSQLDADRMDYILRDGHMTGVRIGSFDLERILAMLDVVDGHLGFHRGGQAAVEGYLLARFHMYQQVYLHKTSRTAERMLVTALERATALRLDDAIAWWPPGPLGDLLAGGALPPTDFARLDDVDVWYALKAWTSEEDAVLSDLAGGLIHRRLWKAARLPETDDARADEMVSAARSVARVRGFDPEHHVLVDASRDSPYRPFTGMERHRGSIRLIDAAGRGRFIEDRSDVVEMLGRLRHRQRLLCYHPALREPLARLVEPSEGGLR
ncbi:MAG: HD domain-containing protein [Myxococcota bacterium]